MTEKRIGVAGATGFIGCRLCAALETRDAYVRALGRREVDGPWDTFVRTDLTQGVSGDALDDVDTVFHLAGKAHALSESRQDEDEYFRINTEGTRKLLEEAKTARVKRFVFFSSIKAMGEGGDKCLDESVDCQPETPYGRSKLEAERLVLKGGYVPEPVVLRLSMVYGPARKGNLPRMIEAVRRGRFLPLPETGNKRSMVHVDDVVQAAMLAAEKPEAAGQTYIVADGTPYSTRQIYEWILEALDKPVPSWSIPVPVLQGLATVGDGIGNLRGKRFIFDSEALQKLTGSAWYDSGKICRELGFNPEIHLHDALPGIVQFLHDQ